MRLRALKGMKEIKRRFGLTKLYALTILSPIFLIVIPQSSFAAMQNITYAPNDRPQMAFVLFYMASCPHCKRFDPVLKQYSVRHHIPVLAYTLDGRSLPSFPSSVTPSQDEMNQFFPNGNAVVPTLFLMDLDKQRMIPVLKGEATQRQLSQRMKQLKLTYSLDGGNDE